jgi:hypothetical protein
MKRMSPVTLCGEKLPHSMHICAFFDSRKEQFETLIPYFKEGLDNQEEVICILESDQHEDFHQRSFKAGLNLKNGQVSSGQFKLLASEQSYLKDGHFAADRMFTMLEQALMDAKAGPHENVRTCGDMVWALKNLPGTDELMEYEARINTLVPKYNCCLMCAYDINRFSASAIADVLATHSHVILNGRIHKNAHYIEPMELLPKLLRRRKQPLSARPD